jgi:hypothetical protein
VPMSRLTTGDGQAAVNNLFYSNVRQLVGHVATGRTSALTARPALWAICSPTATISPRRPIWTATNVTVTANSDGNPADNRRRGCKARLKRSHTAQRTPGSSRLCAAFPSSAVPVERLCASEWPYLRLSAANDGVNTYSAFFNVRAA